MKTSGKSLIAGALAGLANGLFGAGGGMFLVPLYKGWAKMETKKAFASSVAVIFVLSVVSSIIYYFKGRLDLSDAWPYLLGGLGGGIISGTVFKKVPVIWLRRAFGALIIYGGIRSVLLL